MKQPVYIPLSINTDTTGAGQFQYTFGQDFYYSIKAVVNGPGNPAWTLQASQSDADYKQGPRQVLGPALYMPGETCTVIVTGAIPSSVPFGSLIGLASTDMNEILTAPHVSQSAITVNTFILTKNLYPDDYTGIRGIGNPSFVVPALGNVTKTFTLLPGTTNLRISQGPAPGPNTFSTNYSITIIGVQSGIEYLLTAGAVGSSFGGALNAFRPINIPVSPDWDRQVTIQIVDSSNSAGAFSVSALFDSETTTITSINNVVPISAAPRTLQSLKIATNLSAAISPLISAQAGSTVVLVGFTGVIDTSVVGSVMQFEDTNGGLISFHASNKSDYSNFPFGNGAYRISIGLGVQLHNPNGPTSSINGTLFWFGF